MSEYIRSTRECLVTELHPEILQAIWIYFQEHQVGNLQSEQILCCETISRKKSASKTFPWLNSKPDTTIYTGILLTSRLLIWVHHGDHSGTRLNAANLYEIQAEYYNSPLAKDAGLEIVGFTDDSNVRIHGHIGMGTDPAAQDFCEAVREAIIKAKPDATKPFFSKWLSGS